MALILWYAESSQLVRSTARDILMSPDLPLRFHESFKFPEVGQGDTVLILGDKMKPLLEVNKCIAKNRTISSLRGVVHSHEKLPRFMLTYHPSIQEYDYAKGVDVLCDLQAAKRLALTGSLLPTLGSYTYTKTLTAFREEVELKFTETGKPVPVSLDLETLGTNPYNPQAYILNLAVSHAEKTATALSFTPLNQPTPGDITSLEGQLWLDLHWLLNTNHVSIRGANLKFDLIWIAEKWSLFCTNFKFDTLLVGSLLDENRSNSLKVHAKVYSDLGGYSDLFDKQYDKGRMDLIPEAERLEYVAADADATIRVANVESELLQKNPMLTRFYVKVLHPAARAFEKVERCGVHVDQLAYQKLRAELENALDAHEQKALSCVPLRLRAKWAEKASLTKAKFLADYMFSEIGLGLTPKMFTAKTGAPSTAMDHFEMFGDDPRAKPFVDELKAFNSAKKTLSTFVTGFLQHLQPDGRFHPTYFLANQGDMGGTVTGRLSAKDPAFQTLPKHTVWAKKLRKCFVVPPGYVMLGPDYCLPGDSLVQLTKGLTRIDEVLEGDYALVDGEPHKVTFSGKAGTDREIVSILGESGKRLRCTPDHPVYVVRNGWFQYVQAGELTSEDWLVSESRLQESGSDFDEDLAYIGGLFMGYGCYVEVRDKNYPSTVRHHLKFALGQDSECLTQELEKWFCKWTGVGKIGKNGDVEISAKHAVLDFVKRFPKKDSSSVHVPDCIFKANLLARRAFLAGAFDSDGSATSMRIVICSVSEKYIRQIAILASSVGVYGHVLRVVRDTNFKKNSSLWQFVVQSPEAIKAFPSSRIPRKEERLVEYGKSSYTQSRTQKVPMDLIETFNGRGVQNTPASNRLFSNGRRKGAVMRPAIVLACEENPILEASGVLGVLEYHYDKVVSVEPDGAEDVYDLTVEDVHCFNADGYRVHNCQGELKIAACLAGEPTMIEAYSKGIDLHAVTAAGIAGWEFNEFMALKDADPDQYDEIRQLGKAGNFGLLYGMGAGGFRAYAETSYGVSMTLEEAESARNKFFETYPVLLEWHSLCKGYARRHRQIHSPLGRIRHLPLINSPIREVAAKAERQSINSPVQSTLSDMSLWATAIMDKEFGMSVDGFCVIGMVHDQLLAYAPEDEAELWAARLKDVMENLPFEQLEWQPQLRFTVDMTIGYSLADLKKWQAPGEFSPALEGSA